MWHIGRRVPSGTKNQGGNTEEVKVFFLEYQKGIKKVEIHANKEIYDVEEEARSLFQLDDDLDVNILDEKRQRTLEPGTKLKELQNEYILLRFFSILSRILMGIPIRKAGYLPLKPMQ